MPAVSIESVTPILVVNAIEPCLDFWLRLGFQKIAEVPHGDRLGFVMFTNGTNNLMLQKAVVRHGGGAAAVPESGTPD